MRCLVAPQEFKGFLTAVQAAEAIAQGVARGLPGASLDIAPLSDGGPGLVDAVLRAVGGTRQSSRVSDPLGRAVLAHWAILDDSSTAVIEMAAASGLALLLKNERNPRTTSTFGTGQLIRAALDAGCRHLIVGVGGSATNDGGAGAAQALGVALLDSQGRPLHKGGAPLPTLERIDIAALDPRLKESKLEIAVDVQNPLFGPQGASRIYGPQKGATPEVVSELDAALEHFAQVVKETLHVDVAAQPGVGAAGGLAYGLVALCGGQVRNGFETVAKFLRLDERILKADVVITGEGRLDRQSEYGKGPVALARLARTHAKRTVIFAGSIDHSVEWGEFDEAAEVSGTEPPPNPQVARELLERCAESWASRKSAARS